MTGKIIRFPIERTKAWKELLKGLRSATAWWPSEAERRREIHRTAMAKFLPRQEAKTTEEKPVVDGKAAHGTQATPETPT